MNHEESQHEKNEVYNPNSIGELLSLSSGIETKTGKVYRSVYGIGAVEDLMSSGVVRNAASAGVKEESRWGDRVFWSKGEDGKKHTLQKGGYVIEAPHDVASVRQVRAEDVTAVFTKIELDEVIDILPEYLVKKYSI